MWNTLIAWMISNARLVGVFSFAGLKACLVVLVLRLYLLIVLWHLDFTLMSDGASHLAGLYPSLPTWFLPETWGGYVVYLLMIVSLTLLGSYFHAIARKCKDLQ